MRRKCVVFTFLFLFGMVSWGLSQQKWPQVRQGEYAESLVRALKIQRHLPLAFNEEDCISLLEGYGVSPLKGWDRNAPLTKDDFAAVVVKARGREKDVHSLAQKICNQMVASLNSDRENISRLKDACPYGVAYQRREDGKFTTHRHIIDSPLKKVLYSR